MCEIIYEASFKGESVDDCGGGYSESIAEMCEELQNGSLPLLILTPNGREEAGTNRDCFILNPSTSSAHHLKMFKFLGILMGIAIRTGSPLSLNLAEPVWKALVQEILFLILFQISLMPKTVMHSNTRLACHWVYLISTKSTAIIGRHYVTFESAKTLEELKEI